MKIKTLNDLNLVKQKNIHLQVTLVTHVTYCYEFAFIVVHRVLKYQIQHVAPVDEGDMKL